MTRVAILTGAAMVCLLVSLAHATPIKPDVRKLVETPPAAPAQYEPARAGWNGPETSPGQLAMAAAQEAHVRAVRRALATVVIPNPWAWAGILLMIVVLRKLRTMREAKAPVAAPGEPEWQMPRAA